MPHDNFKNCATCHNFEPSLIIIIDDGDYTSKRKYFKSKNSHNAHVSHFNG
jgi:hypothetical protein